MQPDGLVSTFPAFAAFPTALRGSCRSARMRTSTTQRRFGHAHVRVDLGGCRGPARKCVVRGTGARAGSIEAEAEGHPAAHGGSRQVHRRQRRSEGRGLPEGGDRPRPEAVAGGVQAREAVRGPEGLGVHADQLPARARRLDRRRQGAGPHGACHRAPPGRPLRRCRRARRRRARARSVTRAGARDSRRIARQGEEPRGARRLRGRGQGRARQRRRARVARRGPGRRGTNGRRGGAAQEDPRTGPEATGRECAARAGAGGQGRPRRDHRRGEPGPVSRSGTQGPLRAARSCLPRHRRRGQGAPGPAHGGCRQSRTTRPCSWRWPRCSTSKGDSTRRRSSTAR